MSETKLLDNLFRHESGKLIAILTKIFGPHNLELAEDVVQDTLVKALEHWRFNGTPENPTAWLLTVARNKAMDVIRRERHHKEFATEVSPLLKSEYSAGATLAQLVNENEIEDEQLRMMFVCCHPMIAEEGQIALILKTLCGFSVGEIAKAFLTSEETITKRLYRARQYFRTEKVAFALPSSAELQSRLNNVLTAIYLIFNEGYNSSYSELVIREDLVEESLRLGKMLADHPITRGPESLSLLALCCFQASRLFARVDDEGNLVMLKEQDRSKWSEELIRQGIFYLQNASEGDRISTYHLEAAIAHEHCIAKTYDQTDWKKILQLYEWLLQIKPDPLIALNMLVVFAEINGPKAALEELKKIKDKDLLKTYYLYPTVLGEWNAQIGNLAEARSYFEQAKKLTHSPAVRKLIEGKLEKLVKSSQ